VLPVLRSLGANLDFENKYGKTALALAAEQGNVDGIRALVKHGAAGAYTRPPVVST
jgi:ankyrin repeat protein